MWLAVLPPWKPRPCDTAALGTGVGPPEPEPLETAPLPPALPPVPLVSAVQAEIGRASCRESVQLSALAGRVLARSCTETPSAVAGRVTAIEAQLLNEATTTPRHTVLVSDP